MTLANNRWHWTAAAFLLAAVPALQADYVILSNDQRIEGTEIRRKLDGTVILKVQGTGGAGAVGTQEFGKGAYKAAVADTPPQFAPAVQALRAKKYDEVIALLSPIASDKAGLEVDKQLRAVIARAYVGKGNPSEAVAQFDALVKVYGEGVRKESSVGMEYAGALLAAKQNEKLVPVLDELIQNGGRAAAAKAQTMRGQMREGQGQLDAALIDYMRTVIFYERETDAVAEALYRAANVLKMKKDPRANMLYKRLAEEYKDSPFAAGAAGHS